MIDNTRDQLLELARAHLGLADEDVGWDQGISSEPLLLVRGGAHAGGDGVTCALDDSGRLALLRNRGTRIVGCIVDGDGSERELVDLFSSASQNADWN